MKTYYPHPTEICYDLKTVTGSSFDRPVSQLRSTLRSVWKSTSLCIFLIATASVAGTSQTSASILSSAQEFGVLAGATVTNTGSTFIQGDVGVSPGTAITGFPPGTITGSFYSAGAIADQAQQDALAAYQSLAGELPTLDLTGQDLGGMTLTTGVFNFDTSAQLTGFLILDGQGNNNARFDFLIGSTLTTASNATVLLINGASFENVYWQVGSSATLGIGTEFQGNIIADQSITLNTGANLMGRALALNGAVTLDSNLIMIPEPSSLILMGLFFCLGGAGRFRKSRVDKQRMKRN